MTQTPEEAGTTQTAFVGGRSTSEGDEAPPPPPPPSSPPPPAPEPVAGPDSPSPEEASAGSLGEGAPPTAKWPVFAGIAAVLLMMSAAAAMVFGSSIISGGDASEDDVPLAAAPASVEPVTERTDEPLGDNTVDQTAALREGLPIGAGSAYFMCTRTLSIVGENCGCMVNRASDAGIADGVQARLFGGDGSRASEDEATRFMRIVRACSGYDISVRNIALALPIEPIEPGSETPRTASAQPAQDAAGGADTPAAPSPRRAAEPTPRPAPSARQAEAPRRAAPTPRPTPAPTRTPSRRAEAPNRAAPAPSRRSSETPNFMEEMRPTSRSTPRPAPSAAPRAQTGTSTRRVGCYFTDSTYVYDGPCRFQPTGGGDFVATSINGNFAQGTNRITLDVRAPGQALLRISSGGRVQEISVRRSSSDASCWEAPRIRFCAR